MANFNKPMNGNGGNNGGRFNQEITINTNSIPMYNGDNCLKVSFMNDSMAIRIIPVTIREDGSRSFPKDSGQWCVVKYEYAVVILRWLKEYFIPTALANFNKQIADSSADCAPVMIGVPVNKENTNMVAFRYTEPKDGSFVPKLYLFGGINEARIPSQVSEYEFGIKRIFTKYDSKTGDYEFNMDQVQFWIFMKILENFVNASTMAEAHAGKVASSYVNREMRDLIRQIAQANGIATYNNTFSNSRPNFDDNQFVSAPAANLPTPAPTPTVATLEDMMGVPGEGELPF